MSNSVQPVWQAALPLQQQSVMWLALRGPDGIPKSHPCKDVQRAYRGSVLKAARFNRELYWGERADSFMSLNVFADDGAWKAAVDRFWDDVDALPLHFVMHLAHGAQVLGYKHPDPEFRHRWLEFYLRACTEFHLAPELEPALDDRLNDWGQVDWAD
jgi:hypothetical protein